MHIIPPLTVLALLELAISLILNPGSESALFGRRISAGFQSLRSVPSIFSVNHDVRKFSIHAGCVRAGVYSIGRPRTRTAGF